MLDKVEKAGVANLVASMMNEGTKKTKTPEELEEAIGLLGASIRVTSSNEDISLEVSSIAKNLRRPLSCSGDFFGTRWDSEAFDLTKSRIINNLNGCCQSRIIFLQVHLINLCSDDNILAGLMLPALSLS